ncbi:MAG: molybdate ABC transporter substrate-binding protein [Syntrophomonadaceae bacterium]|nr:molybdate ABC transporter substrate-binding protein [Syntrophomonadaceae bacterium]
MGRISLFIRHILLLALAVGILWVAGCSSEKSNLNEESATDKVLFAYVGANLKEPFSDLATAYEKKTGVKIEITYNNSGALLNQVEIAQKGDIFMPGGMPFINKAKEKGVIDEVAGPIAYHTPVIVVPQDNPANIKSIYDLANPDVTLLVPDLEATAIGKTIAQVFEKTSETDQIKQNIIAHLESPAKVMAAIKIGQANAGIVEYSNSLKDADTVNRIEIDADINVVDEIPIASLTFATNKEEVRDFIDFVGVKGPTTFEEHGFKITK